MTTLEDVARLLPDYALGQVLGRGEFGLVWQARHVQLGREVAVKQLAGPVAADPNHAARFRREARILASLDHPHVVRVFDYREADETRILVMELLTGGTLADRRQRGVTLPEVVAATMAAASGLHHVHGQGVLHRDVKPENLMFDGRGVLKVTDFGIARGDELRTTALNVTRADEFFGTPAYIAPEQAAPVFGGGWPAVGPAADQYSLAAVLYEALSNALTHDASGGWVGLCTARMNEEARSLSTVAPAIPDPVANVVMRALRRDPAERFPSVEAFAVALGEAMNATYGREWRSGSDVDIRDAGLIRDVALPPPPSPPSAPPRRHSPVRLGAVAIAAMLAFGGATWWWTSRGGSTPPPRPTVPARELAWKLTRKWSTVTGGNVFASPAVANGMVVVGSEDGSVYGLRSADGTEVWKHATRSLVQSSAVVDGATAYVGGLDGEVVALDVATGAVRWHTQLGVELVSSPVVADGLVLIGADGLRALDVTTGVQRWQTPPHDGVLSSPAVSDGVAVVGANDGTVYGVDVRDGSSKWTIPTGAAVESSPVIVDGIAYVGGIDSHLYAIEVATGRKRWSVPLGAPVKSSPAVIDGRVIVGNDAGDLVALDPKRGRRIWTFRAARSIVSSPAAAGGAVVVGSTDGRVYAVDVHRGHLLGRFVTAGPVLSSPAVADRVAYIGSQDDHVYAIAGLR